LKALIYIAWWGVKAWQIPLPHVAELRRRFPDITFVHEVQPEGVLSSIQDVDIAFSSRLSEAMVERARRLRWVHSSAAAVEGLLPLQHLERRGIPVTNSRGIQAIPIAEQVIAGLLSLARRLDLTLAAQRERRWIQSELCETHWPGMLFGRKMTIVGLGTIGMEVARRAPAFGIRVTGVRRRTEHAMPEFVARVFGQAELHAALEGADILVIAAPAAAHTRHLIGERQLSLLQSGAVLVNVARSQIVDQAAMIDALRNGRLGGAVLDVFDEEPLASDSPLWTIPGVIITPHSAGFRESHWDEVIDLFSENLRRYRAGESLLNEVDCAAGY
jgi:phosphoglycerate dehydrogenase-like enzyme